MHHTIYERKQPTKQALRQLNDRAPALVKRGGAKPLAEPLPRGAAEHLASLIEVERSQPESLLIETSEDGSVRVAVERALAEQSPGSELTEDAIERAVTQYGKNEWWVHGRHGPYKTREAAIHRLRTLGD